MRQHGRLEDGSAAARRRGERGLSLAEIIVAAALALIGFLVALILYQAARDLFRRGEQAADQQQQVRLGFDQMVRDLRLAGFNSNPDGSKLRTDEQLEGAWTGAILLRADFDNEDTTGLADDPETLIKGPFNIISTGNDEIVGFVLRKPDGSGGTTLTADLDVNSGTTATSARYGAVAARDLTRETVSLTNVDLTQTNPPYTLYRVSLNNSASAWGTANFVQYTPIADNIKSLSLKYYNSTGTEVTAPGGAETAAAVNARASIVRIEITLVGMTPSPDPKYFDPTDTLAASRNYRKFSLTSDVTPRNLGRFGVPDLDLTPPSTPTGLATCAGHCQGMVVKWNNNPAADLVAQYTVRYGTTSGNLTASVQTPLNWAWIAGLSATTYYFQVRAEDLSGNVSGWTNEVSALVRDDVSPTLTTPAQVDQAQTSISGNGGAGMLESRITLSWPAMSSNVETLTCDPGGPNLLRDPKGYRIFRSTSASAGPTGTPLIDENVLVTNSYTDTNVVNCRDYYYYVQAWDTCVHGSAHWASSKQGRASTAAKPLAPTGVNSLRTGLTTVRVSWNAVTQNDASPPQTILVDNYEIWRLNVPSQGSDPNGGGYVQIGTITNGQLYFDDTSAPAPASGDTPYYKVRAKDDCPNIGAFSAITNPTCPFTGTITISPPNGQSIALGAPVTLVATYAGTETLVNCNMVVNKSGGAKDYDQTLTGPGPIYTFNSPQWTSGQGTGNYVATATISNSIGCVGTGSATYTVVAPPVCNLTINPAATSYPGSGASSNPRDLMDVTIQNTGSTAVDISQIVVRLRLRQTCASPTPAAPQIEKIEWPVGTVLYNTSPAGTALPATATLSSPIRINASSSAIVRFDFAPGSNAVQDKCGPTTVRNSFNGDLIFNNVGVLGNGTCNIASFNDGLPNP